jgi:hypothetical protein
VGEREPGGQLGYARCEIGAQTHDVARGETPCRRGVLPGTAAQNSVFRKRRSRAERMIGRRRASGTRRAGRMSRCCAHNPVYPSQRSQSRQSPDNCTDIAGATRLG